MVIWDLRAKARLRLALAYLSAAILLGLIAAWAGGLAMGLWWGALALAAVAVIYAGPGAEGFRKKNGRHPLALKVLLAPYLIVARLLPHWRSRHAPEPCLVRDGVWIGRLPFTSEMARAPFGSLMDMTAELSIEPGKWQYRSLPCLDVVALSAHGLATAAREIERLRESSGPVLVACALGRGRSASAVAAWLIATGRAADVSDAIAQVQRARPQAVFREAHRQALAGCFPARANEGSVG
jgi:protein-tyrosine phosphatase